MRQKDKDDWEIERALDGLEASRYCQYLREVYGNVKLPELKDVQLDDIIDAQKLKIKRETPEKKSE